jgi:cystine transport system substrate-binding protein
VSPALELYALESDLASARERIADLDGARVRLAAEQASARRGLRAATAAMRASQASLARLVRALYEAGEVDPIAVVLGARSLDEAITGLDSLQRTARQNRAIRDQARAARRTVTARTHALAARARRLSALEAEARAHAAALESALTRKRAYVADLRRRAGEARAAAAERLAAEAQQRSAALTSPAAATTVVPAATLAAPAAADTPAAVRGVRTLTVDAVAYSLPGHTASGLPVGHGVVAVDPNVIPLGTRMFVPGYGAAVAADVGTAVQGTIIDLWFSTLGQAQAWGRRTVTITLL